MVYDSYFKKYIFKLISVGDIFSPFATPSDCVCFTHFKFESVTAQRRALFIMPSTLN